MTDLRDYQLVEGDELVKNLTRLLQQVNDEGPDVVITHNGKPAACLIGIEKYLEMKEALREFSDPEYVQELLKAQREIRVGGGVPSEDVLREKGL